MPAYVLVSIGSAVYILVACVTKDISFLSVQQTVGSYHMTSIAVGESNGTPQAQVGIHPDVCLHPKVLLFALLALVHAGVSRLAFVLLGRRRCRNLRGIRYGACLELPSFGLQQGIDCGKELIGQFVTHPAHTQSE